MSGHDLKARLGRSFLLQAAFIGLAALIGVFLAGVLLQQVLIRRALQDEAEHFWARRAAEPGFPLPDTRNLRGYLGSGPPALADVAPGFHPWHSDDVRNLVYIVERDGQRLTLVFDGGRVQELATWFGLVPFALVLLLLYGALLLGYRTSRRAISPVIALARDVRRLDPNAETPAVFDPRGAAEHDDEVRELATALSRYTQRLSELIQRERQFTRDASHELRSPLTVIQIASDMVLSDPALPAGTRRTVQRIRRAAQDMEELIGAFLLLARETEVGLPTEAVCINDVVADEIERARAFAGDKPVESAVDASCRLTLQAPHKVLAVLLGNLLRNAYAYTAAGSVRVTIDERGVVIEDSGVGMSAETVAGVYRPFGRGDGGLRGSHGLGLTIVRRLSDRFGWPVDIRSQPGIGTRVEVVFPGAVALPPA